ncbi:MAG: hypothetical protein FD145_399 [Candidatus Saganbacteria bacterium]|uniref:Uncharacterized protein n=1 Tax=Candidatus Saganbacteria bacterium TaxID=2575572 RepID=A0A833L1X9_UNCSA|nr:MAG: hypothetical protein FD145_399 [Candidatus Saganbacteria bacterium]
MANSDNILLTNKLEKKCSGEIRELYKKLHKLIVNVSKRNINYDIYPIYITYYNIKTDKVFVVIYLNRDFLNIGISLDEKQKYKGVKSADYMKYPGITKCVRVDDSKDINIKLKNIIAISYKKMDKRDN